MFASSSWSRIGADEYRPMTFEHGGICQKMRCYHLGSLGQMWQVLPLYLWRLGWLGQVTPLRCKGHLPITRVVCHELSWLCGDYNAPVLHRTRQRLDIIATTDVSVWGFLLCMSKAGRNCRRRHECVEKGCVKDSTLNCANPWHIIRAMSMATVDIMLMCYDDYGTSLVVWICGLIKVE